MWLLSTLTYTLVMTSNIYKTAISSRTLVPVVQDKPAYIVHVFQLNVKMLLHFVGLTIKKYIALFFICAVLCQDIVNVVYPST